LPSLAEFSVLDFIRLALVLAGLGLVLTAALIDIRKFIIPNWLNLLLLIVGLAYAGVTSVGGEQGFPWVLSLACFAVFFFAGTLLFSLGFLGGGDVKLLAILAFWAGTQHIFQMLVYIAIAGGVVSAVYLLKAMVMRNGNSPSVGSDGKVVAADAGLPHTDGVTNGKASVLRQPVPYGVAIAAGGVYVFASIARQLS